MLARDCTVTGCSGENDADLLALSGVEVTPCRRHVTDPLRREWAPFGIFPLLRLAQVDVDACLC